MRRSRSNAAVSIACAAALLGLGLRASVPVLSFTAQSPAATDLEKTAQTVCGGCHAVPPPDILPRHAWRDEFVRMMFIRENRQPPPGPPEKVFPTVSLPADMEQVLATFLSRAPERLPAPERWPDPAASPVRFTRRGLAVPDMPGASAVSHVRLVDLDGDGRLDLLGADMRQGIIFSDSPSKPERGMTVLAQVPHPAHVTVADVDKDGVRDLLVGDLGEFFPGDHEKGAVVWLRGREGGKFSAITVDGWPRVADVESADFNGDGRNDLAVAAFGWRKVGQVAILENRTTAPGRPEFTRHTIDARPGAIHVIPVDFNRDGHLDLVTLLSQQFESVVVYVNRGRGDFTFDQKVIYAAPHPNWGSSGIELVDLDKDGDLDVLLTHGDSFDDGIVKPYHGIQWLENTGSYPFVEHTLAQMAGVHRAQAADLDGDGDLDVVAAALLAGGADVDESILPALVWLEQTTKGTFVRHTIEKGFPRHATLDVGDIDADGDADIVVGNFFLTDKRSPNWVEVWVNQAKKAGAVAVR
jgi:hypothetical protein